MENNLILVNLNKQNLPRSYSKFLFLWIPERSLNLHKGMKSLRNA